jgi:cytochrome aa3-600 menaquinol oxidase subunit 3
VSSAQEVQPRAAEPWPVAFAEESADLAAPAMPAEFADEEQSLKIAGFWMLLVTDILIFASLFASYAVYRPMVAAGPTAGQILGLGPALAETVLLLSSSFTVGIAVWLMRRGQRGEMMAWLGLTLILGAAFVGLELHEFAADVAQGASWRTSAFLSSFFLLVSTHGAHVTFGILWALALLAQVARRGLTAVTARKIYTFSLYWHFLDIIWVFIYTVVYLGAKIA